MSNFSFAGHEELMLLYLAYNGPLIAEIDASPIASSATSYQRRKEIMLDQTSCRNDDDNDETKNHVVQIVGYDLM